MKKIVAISLFYLIPFTMMLTACGSTEPDIPENAALVIVGKVDQEIGWLEETVRAMDTVDVESTNNNGESEAYTGVSITSLLDLAGVKPEAAKIVFFSDDGKSSGEIPISDVLSCEHCIVSFRTKGGFSVVAPDLGKDAQIKGVIRIEVK